MSTYKITIPYTPKPKASIRLGKQSYYNPSARGMLQTREYVKNILKNKTYPLLSGPLLVIVHYRLPAPLSLSAKKRAQQNFLPHVKKPDGDNLEKFLNDALNGIIWTDDSNIAWLVRSKSITANKTGSTTIFVREIPFGEPDYSAIIDDIREHICIEEEV